MFEHHTLLWKESQTKIELRKLPGGIKRKIAGLDFFVTKALAPGRIAFSRDWPGQCIPAAPRGSQSLNVREHHFLAASDNVDYSFERVKGVRNMLLGGSGFFIDNFAGRRRRDRGQRPGGTSSRSNSGRASRSTSSGGWPAGATPRWSCSRSPRPEDRHVRRRPQDDVRNRHRPGRPRDPDPRSRPSRASRAAARRTPRRAASRGR